MAERKLSKSFDQKALPPAHAPLVLDVDTGRDDAWALLGAFDEHEVAAVVSTYGNVPLQLTTRNSLDVVYLAQMHGQGISEAEKNVGVWSGVSQPLLPASSTALAEITRRAGINGNGLCNLLLPQNPQGTQNQSEVWMKGFKKFLESQPEPVNYVVCGPLTNLASLIESFGKDAKGRRKIKNYIQNVIVMGGSFNKEQPVDFNFKADPRAAQRVLSTFGDKLYLFPFDETKKLKLSLEQIEGLAANCKPSAFSRELMKAHAKGWSPDGNIMLHDPATLLAFVEASQFVEQTVKVSLHGKDAGRTLNDQGGASIKRFVIGDGEEVRTRDFLLKQYLNLHPMA